MTLLLEIIRDSYAADYDFVNVSKMPVEDRIWG